MQTYLISDTGTRTPVTIIDTFQMSDGRKMAVVDASCGGLYPDRCPAITCAAGDLVRLSAEADDEALADEMLDLYDRTHQSEPVAVDWTDELQGCELSHLGVLA